MAQRSTYADMSYTITVGLAAALAVMILVGPVIIVLMMSFSGSAALKFPPSEWSLRWYRDLFDSARSAHIHTAAGNSLWVAAVATGSAPSWR